jgi:uncharacterized protein with NRDE domain
MCTVVFIPGNKKIFFGSLRDESPKRQKAILPQVYADENISFLAPKDPVAGGTWVGVNNVGNVIVLLNGGFENHEKRTFYRKSRGLIVAALLATEKPVAEWDLIDMEDIEPFTLVVWTNNNLFQLVWDGEERHRALLDAKQSYIWSSSTLYNVESKIKRKQLFQQWTANKPQVTIQALLNFFNTYDDAENGFMMNRNEITKTLSYTFVELTKNENAAMGYVELLKSTCSNCVASVTSIILEKEPLCN